MSRTCPRCPVTSVFWILIAWTFTSINTFNNSRFQSRHERKIILPSNLKSNKCCRELTMKLRRLSKTQLGQLFPTSVTRNQWISYWGYNPRETLQRILESVLLSYGGAWLAWFLSFMAGSFVSGIAGSLFIFNWLYSPWLTAYRRNSGLRSRDYCYGLFESRIKSLKRLRRRAGKNIDSMSQEFLRVVAVDERGRRLEIVTEWQECYDTLRVGLPLTTVVVSPSSDFSKLACVTECWVPIALKKVRAPASRTTSDLINDDFGEEIEEEVWIGDYPYMLRPQFRELCIRCSSHQSTERSSRRATGQEEADKRSWPVGNPLDREGTDENKRSDRDSSHSVGDSNADSSYDDDHYDNVGTNGDTEGDIDDVHDEYSSDDWEEAMPAKEKKVGSNRGSRGEESKSRINSSSKRANNNDGARKAFESFADESPTTSSLVSRSQMKY